MPPASISPIDEMPILRRLALSYAPPAARGPTLALLALDTRLAAILRAAREPMMAQLRLAWWREQLKADAAAVPAGDPLLSALLSWGPRREILAELVDGWEALTAAAPLPVEAFLALADARGAAFGVLAEVVGVPRDREQAARLGRRWALFDLTAHLGDPEERRRAAMLAEATDRGQIRLGRRMRPLVVLDGLAGRAFRRGDGPNRSGDLLAAMRLGLLGR